MPIMMMAGCVEASAPSGCRARRCGVCRFGNLRAYVLSGADVPAPNRDVFRMELGQPYEIWPVYARDKRQTSVRIDS